MVSAVTANRPGVSIVATYRDTVVREDSRLKFQRGVISIEVARLTATP
jgi:hypothetical protein